MGVKEIYRSKNFTITQEVIPGIFGALVEFIVWRVRGDSGRGYNFKDRPDPYTRIKIRLPQTDDAENRADFNAKVRTTIKELTDFVAGSEQWLKKQADAQEERDSARESGDRIASDAIDQALKGLFGPPGPGSG